MVRQSLAHPEAMTTSSLLERRQRPPLLPMPRGKCEIQARQLTEPLSDYTTAESTNASPAATPAESTNASPAATPKMISLPLRIKREASVDSTPSESTNASPRPAWTAAASLVLPCKIHREEDSSFLPLRARRNLRNRPSIDCNLVQQSEQDDPSWHSQCPRLEEQYDGFQKLGEGTSGVVYKVRSRKDNEDVAIKVMRMHDEERLSIARKEYEVLRQVSHPNIIKAIDFFTYPMGAVLVLDYFEGKKLGKAVREAPGRRLSEYTAHQLSGQLLGAIAKLHACGIIHRDVKADNILISHDLTDLRLVDFNAAKHLSEGQALTMTGTVDYMPPEVIYGESPSEAADVWAAGLCLYLMLDGRLPAERRTLRPRFDSRDEAPSQKGSLVRLEGEEWEHLSEACKETVRDCLETCHDLRPTAADILVRPWLAADALAADALEAAPIDGCMR